VTLLPGAPATSEVRLGDATIGPDRRCYVIAEAGSNHDRDFDVARRLVDVAVEAGCDAVKFQTYTGSSLYSTKAPRFDYLGPLADRAPHELLDEIALPRDWQAPLAGHCREAGIEFLSSPFDREALDELDALDVAAFKVASFEIVDLAFLTDVGARRRPVVLSTGMATMEEIAEAVASVHAGGARDVCLLQCASLYPAPPTVMNLAAIPAMKEAFGVPVGLSDHSLGIHIPVAAVGVGADLVEKHFTLDRTRPGPDHSFAVEPGELAEMVRWIRDAEVALGDGRKTGPSEEEREEMYTKARRSVVAAQAIPDGTQITPEMLTVKRPGFGIKPRDLPGVVGRRARRDIEADEVVTWDMV
jgi:sialic acid synthase SpsE